MKKIYSLRFLLIVVIAAVCLAGGCTEKLVNDRQDENVQVQMKTSFTAAEAVDQITTFTLTVEAEDIDPAIQVSLPLVEGKFQAEIQVPAGRNRIFTLLAFDDGGAVLYRGITVMDVFPSSGGASPTVTIQLSPEVPMIRVTPHYQEYSMGASFTVDVEVFNLPELDEITFELSHESRVVNMDSVPRPASLNPSANFSTDMTQQETGQIVYVYASMVEIDGYIVDNSGYANLGTYYFTTYSDNILDTALVDLQLTVHYLYSDSEGSMVEIPLEEVTVDDDAWLKLIRQTWELEYGDYGSDIGNDIVETSDGGFVVVGEYVPSEMSFAYMMKIDSLGSYKWGRTYNYGKAGECNFQAVAATSDGGLIMTGEVYIYGDTSSYDVYLVKADAAGNIVWDTAFGESTPTERGYDVIQAADGGYVLCAEKEDSVLLIKTDANGGLVWQTTYKDTVSERHGYYPYGLVQTPDGGFLIAGELAWYSQESGNAFLMKADANGNISWSREYEFDDISDFRDILRASDGNYVMTGRRGSDAYLAKTNSSGDIIWDELYDRDYYSYARSVDEAADGGFLITGTYSNSDLNRYYDIYLIRTDAAGDTAWTRTFGTYNYDAGRAGIATSDGGFIATGYVDNYGTTNYDIVIIKTDANGETYQKPMVRM